MNSLLNSTKNGDVDGTCKRNLSSMLSDAGKNTTNVQVEVLL